MKRAADNKRRKITCVYTETQIIFCRSIICRKLKAILCPLRYFPGLEDYEAMTKEELIVIFSRNRTYRFHLVVIQWKRKKSNRNFNADIDNLISA